MVHPLITNNFGLVCTLFFYIYPNLRNLFSFYLIFQIYSDLICISQSFFIEIPSFLSISLRNKSSSAFTLTRSKTRATKINSP